MMLAEAWGRCRSYLPLVSIAPEEVAGLDLEAEAAPVDPEAPRALRIRRALAIPTLPKEQPRAIRSKSGEHAS